MALLLAEHADVILARLAAAPRMVCGLDFDGTLTPIIADRRHAFLAPGAVDILTQIAALPKVLVAIVSGRALDDVRSRVPIPGVVFAGNHGLDIEGPGLRYTEPSSVQVRGGLRDVAERLRAALALFPGVDVEDKGLTLSIHYRLAHPDDVPAVRQAVNAVLGASGQAFRLTQGHQVCEVRPPTAWHKGQALDLIRRHYHCDESEVLYVGDDMTDEDAFTTLPNAITIKVGAAADTAARYHVSSPSDVERFLARLLDNAPGVAS